MDPAWDGEGWVPLDPEYPLELPDLDPEDPLEPVESLEPEPLLGAEPLSSFDPFEWEPEAPVVLEAVEELFVEIEELSLEDEPVPLALLAVFTPLRLPTPCPWSAVTEVAA